MEAAVAGLYGECIAAGRKQEHIPALTVLIDVLCFGTRTRDEVEFAIASLESRIAVDLRSKRLGVASTRIRILKVVASTWAGSKRLAQGCVHVDRKRVC